MKILTQLGVVAIAATASFSLGHSVSGTDKTKFYVEIPFDAKFGQIMEVEAPVTSMGTLEAVVRLGLIVWTKEEWDKAEATTLAAERISNFPHQKPHIFHYDSQKGWVEYR